MPRYAIDAVTLLRLATGERAVDPAHQLVAPNSIRSQALGLLLVRVSQGLLSDAEALASHDRLTETRMRLLGDRVSRRTAWRIARDRGWDTIHDAEYLAIAKLQADALVTVDEAMAARAAGVVPVEPVEAPLAP